METMYNAVKKYHINGWRGKEYSLTAKELYERVMEDSKYNYDWIASATELVRICKEPDFPREYANEIEIAILNCFADLELRKEYLSHSESTVQESVSYCYHTVSDESEIGKAAKEKYLKAIIHSIIKYDDTSCRLLFPLGPAMIKICDDWEKAKFNEYVDKKEIDFEEMRKVLYKEFEETIKDARERGVFKEDDEKHHEWMKKFFQSFDF